MDIGFEMKMEIYWIIVFFGQVIFQGKQQNYVMLIGFFINFYFYYFDVLKKNLIVIVVVISLLIVLIICIVVCQGYLFFCNVSNVIKNIIFENFDVWLELICVFIELE